MKIWQTNMKKALSQRIQSTKLTQLNTLIVSPLKIALSIQATKARIK